MGLICVAALAAALVPTRSNIQAQQPAADELPATLKFVPADAALFLYADAAKSWDSKILTDIRKSDPKTVDFILGEAKKELGIAPEDVKSLALFVPVLKGPQDSERFALAIAFHKPFDRAKLQAGAEKFLPKRAKLTVLAPDAASRTARGSTPRGCVRQVRGGGRRDAREPSR